MAATTCFQGQSVVELTSDSARAWIAPQYGARLLRWQVNGTDLLYWPEQPDWSKPAKIRGGNPILFPFIARHFHQGNAAQWMDEGTVREMPMHGFARDLPFTIIQQTPDQVLMRLTENECTLSYYPFRFIFDVEIALAHHLLRITFRTTNLSDRPLPCYPGHHFYFPVPAEERNHWRLEIPSLQTARQNPDGSICFHSSDYVQTSLSDRDLIDRMHLLEGPQPVRLYHQTGHPRLRFRFDHPNSIPWGAVTTWTEAANSPFFCVEPWIGLPNAIHHQHGLRRLEPGTIEEAILTIETEL
ncbi:MAG: aldose epimerase [Candidatus Methylacidiphilales bacterium]